LKVVERCPGRGHRVGYRDVIVCGKRHGGGRWTWSYRSRPLHLGRLLYNGRSGETGDTAAGEHAGHEHADDEPQERYDKYGHWVLPVRCLARRRTHDRRHRSGTCGRLPKVAVMARQTDGGVIAMMPLRIGGPEPPAGSHVGGNGPAQDDSVDGAGHSGYSSHDALSSRAHQFQRRARTPPGTRATPGTLLAMSRGLRRLASLDPHDIAWTLRSSLAIVCSRCVGMYRRSRGNSSRSSCATWSRTAWWKAANLAVKAG